MVVNFQDIIQDPEWDNSEMIWEPPPEQRIPGVTFSGHGLQVPVGGALSSFMVTFQNYQELPNFKVIVVQVDDDGQEILNTSTELNYEVIPGYGFRVIYVLHGDADYKLKIMINDSVISKPLMFCRSAVYADNINETWQYLFDRIQRLTEYYQKVIPPALKIINETQETVELINNAANSYNNALEATQTAAHSSAGVGIKLLEIMNAFKLPAPAAAAAAADQPGGDEPDIPGGGPDGRNEDGRPPRNGAEDGRPPRNGAEDGRPQRPQHAPPQRPQHAPPQRPQHAPPQRPQHAPPQRPQHAPPQRPQHAPPQRPQHAPPQRPQHAPPPPPKPKKQSTPSIFLDSVFFNEDSVGSLPDLGAVDRESPPNKCSSEPTFVGFMCNFPSTTTIPDDKVSDQRDTPKSHRPVTPPPLGLKRKRDYFELDMQAKVVISEIVEVVDQVGQALDDVSEALQDDPEDLVEGVPEDLVEGDAEDLVEGDAEDLAMEEAYHLFNDSYVVNSSAAYPIDYSNADNDDGRPSKRHCSHSITDLLPLDQSLDSSSDESSWSDLMANLEVTRIFMPPSSSSSSSSYVSVRRSFTPPRASTPKPNQRRAGRMTLRSQKRKDYKGFF